MRKPDSHIRPHVGEMLGARLSLAYADGARELGNRLQLPGIVYVGLDRFDLGVFADAPAGGSPLWELSLSMGPTSFMAPFQKAAILREMKNPPAAARPSTGMVP